MDPMAEEQLDYGEDEYGGGAQKLQHQGSGGAIPALAEEEMMGDDDEFDDLYNDVNVGEGFMHNFHRPPDPNPPPVPFNNGDRKIEPPTAIVGSQHNVSIPGVGADQNPSVGSSMRVQDLAPVNSHEGNLGFGGGSMAPGPPKVAPLPPQSDPGRDTLPLSNRAGLLAGPVAALVDPNGPTMLFVGELLWWTTDAELESVLSQYGRVKEIKFFDERASGKSKGYCQVEFYDAGAAAACKEGMDGYLFNGRACVVAFASPQTLRQMGAAYLNRTQAQAQSQPQGRRQMNDGMGRGSAGGDNGGRNFGRSGWGGRSGQGMLNRGQGGGSGGGGMMRGRGFMGAKAMIGAGGGVGNGGPYGQGLSGPAAMGGPAGGMMHPQGMMGAGFDPTYMGRGGPYGGFPAPAFTGMMPSFQAVNAVGLPAPHVNPAFFGRGMPANGMGMMGGSMMEGQMWGDPGMGGGWTGEEHGRRTRESSYGGDDGASDYGYGEVNHERGGRSNGPREKERGSERDWQGSSERRHRDEKEQDYDRSERERYRDEKDGYKDYRPRDRDNDDEDWDRGQSSSRPRSKSWMMQEDDRRSRSRDGDYGKRRRLPSE